eukprot:scaffold112568_cov32-Tisochrysis_lutea.AAC.1
MAVDWRLRRREGEETETILLVFVPAQIELHVDLGPDGNLGHRLEDWLEDGAKGANVAKEIEEGELRVRKAHSALVEALERLLRDGLEHLASIEEQEFAALLRLLKADKRTQAVGALESGLIVHAHEELGARRLVDSLVHGALLRDDRARADRGKRVLARRELQELIEALEAVLGLHHLEAPEPDGSALSKLREDGLAVLDEVGLLVPVCNGRVYLVRERALWRAERCEIDALRVPTGERTLWDLID